MNKKVVCFGGGNVVPKLIMAELKKHPVTITGITSMVDNGGSTGQLRNDFDVLPPGDIRRHILALSDAPEWKKQLWQFRFGHEVFDGGHKGHNFANAMIAGTEYALKDYMQVLKFIHEFMEVRDHQALPATIDKIQLVAELENKELVYGEDEIDVPQKHDPNLKIMKIFLEPEAKGFNASIKAILEADLITFGPGDLYSSVTPCLLPKGIKEALIASKAKKVLVCNAMTKSGETNGFFVSDFVDEIEKYAGKIDHVIYNNKEIAPERIAEYKKENPELLEIVKNDKEENAKFIGADIIAESGDIKYIPEKLIQIILSL
jgi:uncharacterized cofD-like protein